VPPICAPHRVCVPHARQNFGLLTYGEIALITQDAIKRLHLKHEALILEALNLLAQAQEIADRNPDFVRFEQDFALKAVAMREALAKETQNLHHADDVSRPCRQ
jgi:hypothetical protein